MVMFPEIQTLLSISSCLRRSRVSGSQTWSLAWGWVVSLVWPGFGEKQKVKKKVKSLSCVQLLATPWNVCPLSSVHGIFQPRVLGWVAVSFSRGFSQSRDQTWVSRIVGRRVTIWATREVQLIKINLTSASYSHDTLYLQHDVMRRTLYLHHLSRNSDIDLQVKHF